MSARSPKTIFLVGVVLVATAFVAIWGLRNKSVRPISATGGKDFESGNVLEVPLYKQWDPGWADDEIGGSGEKLRNVGCTVSCVAMLFSYYGITVTPKEMNDYLKRNRGYTRRGWLKWQKCAEYTQGRVVLEYVGNPDHKRIDENLTDKNPVIAKVLIKNRIPHWVLVVGKEGNEYIINDPLGSEEKPIPLLRYGTKVYALRIYRRVG